MEETRCWEYPPRRLRFKYAHVTFSPMADIVRWPRWGRCMEAFGEDTYLSSIYSKAMVEGFQGDLQLEHNIASCVKRFAAYGAPEAGKEYNTVDMSHHRLCRYSRANFSWRSRR